MTKIGKIDGERFLRIGKMQSDTIGVELNDFLAYYSSAEFLIVRILKVY